MIKPLMSVIEIGDAIGSFGVVFFIVVMFAATVFCMRKYLRD